MPLQPNSVSFEPVDSPFISLFEQNRNPTPEEKQTIRELVAEKAAYLSHLSSPGQLSVPTQVPHEPCAELTYTHDWLEFHRALISPWRQLPVEVMSEIFIFTLEYRGQWEQDDPWYDDRRGTLRLCRICSAWRAIALSTPALWNTLSISASVLTRHEWISIWLARSRSTPVYLQLLWGGETLPDAINSVMSIFESHIHHTAELAIDGLFLFDPETMDEPDEAYPKLTFKPSVESLNASLLSTVVVNLPEGSEWDWIHAVCRATPRLTYLRTSHHSLDSFPLANLTQLEWLETAPMSEIFKLFEDAPNLRDIIISVDGPAVPSSESRLTMKSIAKIEISSDEHLGEFLEHSEFPNLVNLSICSADTWPGPAFHSFLSRSSCTLTVLEFNGCVISPEEIITCLQHSACKTLESFSLDGCFSEDIDVLLRYLTYRGPGPEHPPCSNPNLRSIILFGIYSTDGLLAEMVASRSFTSLPAKSLSKSATQLAPVLLRKVSFTFEDELTQNEDHAKDWMQLREIEKMEQSELKIGWPVGTNLPE